jgi:hypothetical protein
MDLRRTELGGLGEVGVYRLGMVGRERGVLRRAIVVLLNIPFLTLAWVSGDLLTLPCCLRRQQCQGSLQEQDPA